MRTLCLLPLIILGLLSSLSGALATVYDFRVPFSIEEWSGELNSVSGPYEDLLITCTDNDTSYPMPSAGTFTDSGTLYWYGSGWSYSSANVLLAIAKADGRPFTPNSVKINYHTYSPHYVPGTYQGGTIRITAYVGASAVGTWSYYYDGSGNAAGYSTTVNFAGLSGFQNITSLVFDNDRQDLSIQNLVMDSVANTTPSFVGSTTTLTVNQNSLANDVKGLLHVSDADATQTLTWTQNSPPANGQLSIVNASATSGSTDIAPGGTISYTPTAGYFGPDSFSVRVSDGTASATRTISVNVLDRTPPGVMISLPSVILTRSGPVNFTVSYSDPNLDVSSISIDPEDVVLHRTGTVTVGDVVISGTGTSRQISLSGLAGDGTVSLSVNAGTAADTLGNVADSAGPSSAATVDNTAPAISSAPVWSATYDVFSLYRITALGEPAIYGGSGEPAWLLIDQVTGWVRGTPTQSGTFTFTINATDHAGNVGSATLSLQVQKAVPIVTSWPVPSGLVYGQQLSSSVLSGGAASVPGTFTFGDPAAAPSAGLYAAAVKFLPADSDNYQAVDGTVTVEVSRATPAVSIWPSASAITYGDQLAASVLTGGTASQAGSFSFETPATVPNAGSYSAGVRFTPSDTNNYDTVQGTIAVQVDRATPAVTMWPSASGITYGDQLSASVLGGGTASTAGSFAFDAPATVPSAGTYTAAVRFLPADPDNYAAVDGEVIVIVSRATPLVVAWPTASAITYGEDLSASGLSEGTASVAGTFAFVSPATMPSAGTHMATVRFTPADTDNYQVVDGIVAVAVARANPVVTLWPTASAITYGEQLSNSVLTGGAGSVAGTFSFESPTTAPNAGLYTASLRFIPTDADNFNEVGGTTSVNVIRATPIVTTWPTASTITYGNPLSASILSPGTASVPGSFSFDHPAATPGAGMLAAAVTFTPLDAENYNPVNGTVSVNVDRATPVVTAWPTASGITYGDLLSASPLSGGTASVPGAFSFDHPTTAPNAGIHTAAVTFAPTDTDNYNQVNGTVAVNVDRAIPVVTAWPTASGITYGEQLSASVLSSGTASVPGGFSFDSPTTAPSAGTYTAAVTFAPTDTENYKPVNGTASVNVNRATPVVTAWPTASGITYGEQLSASALSGGTASVPGTFSFDHPTTAPNAAIHTAAVTFAPADADNYHQVNGTVAVIVDRATPVVTAWPTASGITYGEQLSASVLNSGTASVPGAFSFDHPTTAPNAGIHTAAVTFAPTDADNYNPVNGTVAVDVDRATPVVTAWPTASGITYGDQLSASPLSGGTASVPGGFSFDQPATAPNAGIHTASVTFTPTDADNYNPVNGTVAVDVDRATPVVTAWPTASGITYGDQLSASPLSGGTASVPGGFSFDSSTTAPNAGTYTAAVTFTPTDTENYKPVNGTVVVEVDRATPAVTAWPTAGDITYGDQLSASVLTGGTASVAGAFSFEAPASAPNAGSYTASVEFTPTDSGNFKNLRGNVQVHVHKAALELKADDVTRNYGQQNPEWELTCTGFVNADELDSLEGELQISFETLEGQPVPEVSTTTAVGGYQIWPAGLFSENYEITFVPGLLEIVPAELTVSCRNVRRDYGAANPPLGVDITGYVNGQGSEVLGGELQISCAAGKESPVGTYPITASGVSCPNYTITFVGGALTVSPASLVLVAHDAVRAYGDPEPVFQATLTGVLNGDRLPIVFATTATRYSPVGSYAIVPSFEDPDHKLRNYTMSVFSAELRVTARELTAKAHNLCRVAGQMNPVLTGTLEGALPDDGLTVGYSTSATVSSAAGRYTIEPVLNGPQSKLENYSVNLVPGTLIVVPPITISASNLLYVLGSGPADVDPAAAVENAAGFDFEGMQLSARVAAPEAGSIEARPANENPNGLNLSDGRLLFNGSVFGSSATNAGPGSVQFAFTTGASAPAVEALLHGLVFSTDTYGSGSRVIEIVLSFGESHVRYVRAVDINRSPVAEPRTILAVANTSFTITEDELLANAHDNDGDVLALRPGVTLGTNGATLTIGGGKLDYTPGPKQDAEEEFTCTIEDARGATCAVTVKFRFIERHRIMMSSTDVNEQGTHVFMAGTPGGEYDIEASADLTNWRPIDTLRASSTGLIEVRDSQAAGLGQRFYRAVAK